jgi:hypothetical protein
MIVFQFCNAGDVAAVLVDPYIADMEYGDTG